MEFSDFKTIPEVLERFRITYNAVFKASTEARSETYQ